MHEDYEHKEEARRAFAREACDWVEAALMAVICVVLLFTFVARLAGVDGISMQPTLEDQDRLIITRLGSDPRPGEIVVVTLPGRSSEPLVKRVIAIQGQTIDINFETGAVLVDGEQLYEPFVEDGTFLSYDMDFPQTVPPGHIFLMGDNRNNSWDSRDSRIGMVDTRHVLGRTVYRVFPHDRAGVPR